MARRKVSMGAAISILARQEAEEQINHADITAFGGCGDCHRSIRQGEERREREARRLAKSVSGLSRREFNVALRKVRKARSWQRTWERTVYEAMVRSGYPLELL